MDRELANVIFHQCDICNGFTSEFWCPKCNIQLCQNCISPLKVGSNVLYTCPKCGSSCFNKADLFHEAEYNKQSFLKVIFQAILFPITGETLGLFIALVMLFGGIFTFYKLLLFRIWIVDGIVGLFYIGSLFTVGLDILENSSKGENRVSKLSNLTSVYDSGYEFSLSIPALIFIVIIAVIFVAEMFMPDSIRLIKKITLLFVLFLLPMALISIAITKSFALVDPLTMLSAIKRVPMQYFLLVAAIASVLTVGLYILNALNNVEDSKILNLVSPFIYTACHVYFVMFAGRILGMFYYCNRNRLNWNSQ